MYDKVIVSSLFLPPPPIKEGERKGERTVQKLSLWDSSKEFEYANFCTTRLLSLLFLSPLKKREREKEKDSTKVGTLGFTKET